MTVGHARQQVVGQVQRPGGCRRAACRCRSTRTVLQPGRTASGVSFKGALTAAAPVSAVGVDTFRFTAIGDPARIRAFLPCARCPGLIGDHDVVPALRVVVIVALPADDDVVTTVRIVLELVAARRRPAESSCGPASIQSSPAPPNPSVAAFTP